MLSLLLGLAAFAGQDIGACRDIEDAAERLACYDRAAEASDTDPRPAPAPAPSPAPAPAGSADRPAPAPAPTPAPAPAPAAPEAEEDRGLLDRFGLRGRDKDEPTQITAGVARIEEVRFGALRVYLDNGQVWQQLDSDNRGRIPREPSEEEATIKQEAFGSHGMKLEPSGVKMKVKRIR